MGNEKLKRATKESLLAKAQSKERNEKKYKEYECEKLGETLMLKKLPIERICSIMDMSDGETMVENLELNKQLLYESIPLFQDKEIQEAFECTEPYDIVLRVLDDDMMEMQKICENILSMYGLAELTDNVKN